MGYEGPSKISNQLDELDRAVEVEEVKEVNVFIIVCVINSTNFVSSPLKTFIAAECFK